jgi:hypothetical protein
MYFRSSRIESHTSLHNRSYTNLHGRQLDKNPLDRSLEFLRKIAELKKLKEEISSIPSRESHHSFNISSSDANKGLDFPIQPKFEDLEVIGFNGFVCRSCLTALPLRIYKNKSNCVLNPILTWHICYFERLMEIQHHKLDKENVLRDLYRNELPGVMLNAVREWTGNKTSIKAVEVSIPVDSCNLITVSNPKRWITRAIHERVTHLTDEELIDFIKIVKDRTYAFFRIHGDELNHGNVFLVNIVASH